MTITILSPKSKVVSSSASGFTLVEVMLASALSALLLTAVLSAFLFLGRSGYNLANYADMETQSRRALEYFAQDTRQASAVTWNSNTSVTLVVNTATITYSCTGGVFSRTLGTDPTHPKALMTGITSFTFLAYTITGVQMSDFSTAALRATANGTTKQIQISLAAVRNRSTVAKTSNIVLSARYILRNKHVTA